MDGVFNQNLKKVSCSAVLTLAYQSLGVVYGDLSTSPLYVYKTTFSGKLSLREDDEEIYGVLSFIFWTFTLIALLKYIFIVMSANDNGEGTSSSFGKGLLYPTVSCRLSVPLCLNNAITPFFSFQSQTLCIWMEFFDFL